MTLKPKWTSESVGEYEKSLKPSEPPKIAQRQWVGLTDDDCLEALKAVDPKAIRLPLGFSMFAANIQAKLKEKNT